MPSTITVLNAVKSTDPITWGQFIRNLPDRPVAFIDKGSWKEILQSVGALHDMELIIVERDRNSNEIISLALTELGLERLNESKGQERVTERRTFRVMKPRTTLA